MNIKYIVPVGSKITRKFYCPVLKKQVALTTDFTEDEIVFNANDANEFAEKVISIHQNYDAYQIKTQNAFEAVMNKEENWEHT